MPSSSAILSMPFCELFWSPSSIKPSTIKASVGVGSGPPNAMAGPLRSGPITSFFSFTRTILSPPIPSDSVLRDLIRLLYWPRLIPTGSSRGALSTRKAISVVVPPISRTIASLPSGA